MRVCDDFDLPLKNVVSDLQDALKEYSGLNGWAAHSWAARMTENAFGPYHEVAEINKLSPEQKAALIPKVEGALAILRAVCEQENPLSIGS